MNYSISDFGLDTLEGLVEKTEFPWLMSNVIGENTNNVKCQMDMGRFLPLLMLVLLKLGLITDQRSVIIEQIKLLSISTCRLGDRSTTGRGKDPAYN